MSYWVNKGHLRNQIALLETKVKHLENELLLTREEYEESMSNYLGIFSNMEKKVAERTKELSKLHDTIKIKGNELQLMLDASPEIIFYMNKGQRYIRVNKTFSRTFGVPIRDILGRTYLELFPDSDGRFSEDNTKVMQTGEPVLKQSGFINTSKGKRQFLVDKFPKKDINGNVIGIIGFATDITDIKKMEDERKTLQERIARSEKLEAIGTLAGGIAHDFNNILFPIIGYSEMTSAMLPLRSIARKNLDRILKAAYRAKDLVLQILAFSKHSELENKPVQIHLVIREVIKLLKAALPSTIQIKYHPEDKNSLVLSDPTQIHQVIMNLCTNAFHAVREKGGVLKIILKSEEIKSDEKLYDMKIKPGPYVKLTISDTGMGIRPEIMDRIFDPYFTTKPPGQGTGVGLSVVLGIIKKLNGDIVVESQPDKGSTFTVYIPKMSQTEVTHEEMSAEMVATGKETILIVDDEEEIVSVSSKMLKSLGYDIITATSGIEALDYFQTDAEKIDIVITDQTMPGMTGTELSKKLLQIKPLLPIILWTGFTESINEKEAKALGIREFVMKPITRPVIARIVRTLLDQKPPGQKMVLNLADILHNIYSMISNSFDKKIEFRKRWPDTLLIEGNPSELNLALMNIFLNANDAMATGGLLYIEARMEKEKIAVIISDTGNGMNQDILNKIYDPYFTTKNNRARPGLGLSTVRSIIQSHKGNIAVYSQPKMGTSFKITFPMHRADQAQVSIPVNGIIIGKGQHILIVDDDETIVALTAHLLQSFGYQTSTTTKGKTAVNKYKTLRPDLVLMDHSMPDMDGLAATKRILSIDPQAKVVISSGYDIGAFGSMDTQFSRLIKAYIDKSFDPAKLSRVIDEVLNA